MSNIYFSNSEIIIITIILLKQGYKTTKSVHHVNYINLLSPWTAYMVPSI